MSNNSRKIETHLRESNPQQVTGLNEAKIKNTIGFITDRQRQVWQNKR